VSAGVHAAVRRLRRGLSWHRRAVAAVLAATAAAGVLVAARPPSAPSVAVVAAAHDLASGATLAPGDVQTVRMRPDRVPAGALRPGSRVDGRVLAGAVRSGETLTDVRLVGPGLADALASEDLVAVPVRLADTQATRLLHPGDLVDVLAARPAGSDFDATHPATPARVVASRVRVVTIPQTGGTQGLLDEQGSSAGALVVLATTPETAADLAGAQTASALSTVVRAG